MVAKLGDVERRAFLKAGVAVAGLAATTPAVAVPGEAALRIDMLRIEWQADPIAIDTVRPRFHWSLSAMRAGARNLAQSGFRLTISEAFGRKAAIYDSGNVSSGVLSFRPAEPLKLGSQTRYLAWLTVFDEQGAASVAFASTFETGLVSPAALKARWIAAEPDRDDRYQAIEGHWHRVEKAQPMPVFQKAFKVKAQPVQAHILIVGLGQYQLYLDGKPISREGVNGGWTNYNKHVQYDAYEIARLLHAGSHRLMIELGNGFFNVEAVEGRYSKLSGRFGQPQALLQLRLVYADGSEAFVVSDGNWKTCIGGTSYSSIYGGEDFDALRASRLSPRKAGWRSVDVVSGPTGVLVASTYAPMTLRRRLKAVTVNANAPGGSLYDFGLNHSGRPRLQITGAKPGDVVTLIPCELLGTDGSPDQASMGGGGEPGLRGIEFNYICKGGTEEWTPKFTYTGYRYLQVRGTAPAKGIVLESEFLSDDLAQAGTFETSDAKMTSIHGLIHQALLSNAASVLTDCPHREKLGWLEQIYLNAATTMNNLDAVRLYEKMCRDMRDAQEDSGMVPAIAPEFIKFLDDTGQNTRFRDSPEWGSALTLATWYAFQRYGDTGILEQNYGAIAARLRYLESRLDADGLLNFGLGDWYDIGPKHPGYAQLTSIQMTGTATFFAELEVMSRIAQRLGKTEAGTYRDRAAALKATMLARLFHADSSTLDTGSQTAQAMGLVLELFPPEHRKAALDHLVADVQAHDNHVTAGDIGFHYVVRALSDGGRSDALYAMLSQTTKPSYLEQIAHGATALTEAWDSWREASQNHFMLGHAEIWFFQGLGGVQIDHSRGEGPAIVLSPQIVQGIATTKVTADTLTGTVECKTRVAGGAAQVQVIVPAGRRAEIRLPFYAAESVREGGEALAKLPGATVRTDPIQGVTVTVGSGIYAFTGRVA